MRFTVRATSAYVPARAQEHSLPSRRPNVPVTPGARIRGIQLQGGGRAPMARLPPSMHQDGTPGPLGRLSPASPHNKPSGGSHAPRSRVNPPPRQAGAPRCAVRRSFQLRRCNPARRQAPIGHPLWHPPGHSVAGRGWGRAPMARCPLNAPGRHPPPGPPSRLSPASPHNKPSGGSHAPRSRVNPPPWPGRREPARTHRPRPAHNAPQHPHLPCRPPTPPGGPRRPGSSPCTFLCRKQAYPVRPTRDAQAPCRDDLNDQMSDEGEE